MKSFKKTKSYVLAIYLSIHNFEISAQFKFLHKTCYLSYKLDTRS